MKRRTRQKQLLAALTLFAALALLNGCVSQVEERAAEDVAGVPVLLNAQAPQADEYAVRSETVTLYFLSADGSRLTAVTREIQVEGGMSRSEAALYALLGGPLAGEDGTWPSIGSLGEGRVYELSDGVATVDLPARLRALDTQELYAVRLAITHTLTEFSEVSYVNVLIGGREEGFDLAATMPLGTLSRAEDMDVTARYLRLDEMRQGAQATGLTRMTTLYFPSADGRYILPEVRSVAYAQLAPIEYLYTLLAEIGKGTDNPLCVDVPAPLEYLEEMPEIVRTEDGAYRVIELRLSADLDEALAQAGLCRGVYLAMLTDTLMGFVPGVEGVLVYMGGEQVAGLSEAETPDGCAVAFAQSAATRADFAGYVGAPGVLYVPSAEKEGKLTAESCVLAQEKQSDARERLWQLTRRLMESGVFEEALAQEDILAVSVGTERTLVNLSDCYARALLDLTQQEQRAVVYAMVNTLSEGGQQEKAAFFFEGEQMENPDGELEMRGEFLRNPGMVVDR